MEWKQHQSGLVQGTFIDLCTNKFYPYAGILLEVGTGTVALQKAQSGMSTQKPHLCFVPFEHGVLNRSYPVWDCWEGR